MPKRTRAQGQGGWRHPSLSRARDIDAEPPLQRLVLHSGKNNDGDFKTEKNVKTVVHWFRDADLRLEDNRSLRLASELAQRHGQKLVTIYAACPGELHAHSVGSARVDFILRGLQELHNTLATKYNIGLTTIVAETPKERASSIVSFARDQNASHVYANLQYEYDELQRDLLVQSSLGRDNIKLELVHDQTAAIPGTILSRSKTPLKVFTPYHIEWIATLKREPDLLRLADPPFANEQDGISLPKFDLSLKKLGYEPPEQSGLEKLWPAGHDSAVKRLREFLKQKVARYGDERSTPALDNSSRLSAYFATGMLSVREALVEARDRANGGQPLTATGSGVAAWVRELAFRDFYRQKLALVSPHVAMNLPESLRLANTEYAEDEEGWKKWCDGTTGVPFVDAGMRQLNTEAFMHNRLRMNVASYLRMTLMLDYRRGAQWFASHLVDWDLANNSFGWEPNYTMFNPVLQGEKCDPDGDYIRKWVPELKDVQGKAIFDPYNRLPRDEFDKLGYPRPHIENLAARKVEAMDMLKGIKKPKIEKSEEE